MPHDISFDWLEPNAREVAAEMWERYGDDAIVGAQRALEVAEESGHDPSIILWEDTCAILKQKLVYRNLLH